MTRKRHELKEIVAKLRQVDVLMSKGRSVADAIRSIGLTEVRQSDWPRLPPALGRAAAPTGHAGMSRAACPEWPRAR